MTTIDDTRAMLIALLTDMGPLDKVADVHGCSGHDKVLMLVGCCCEMIAAAIQTLAQGNRADELLQLECFVDTLRNRLNTDERSNGHGRVN